MDECTDIVYTVTAPAVGGLVSPRWVVCKLHVVRAVLANESCCTPLMHSGDF